MNPDFWRDRPVLITGGTGLIGGWVVQRLAEAGASLVCLVRDWVPESMFVRNGLHERVRIVRGDITDRETLERAINEYEIATVLHLAAQTIVPTAQRGPISTFEANVRGTWQILEACRRVSTVRQVVVASSDKAYGSRSDLPYTEDAPLAGRHPYDVSKSCADLIAQSYFVSYGLPVVITRCGNFFGGGDLNWNRLVPGTIRSVLRGQRPVLRSDGTLVRDYIYAEDGADTYILLAEKLGADGSLAGQAFNFSCEQPLSVIDMTRKIVHAMGADLEPVVLGEGTGEIHSQWLDSSRARNLLGWRPRFTVDEGLARTISWYRDFLGQLPASAGEP